MTEYLKTHPLTLSTNPTLADVEKSKSKIIIPPFAKAVLNSDSKFIDKQKYLEILIKEKEFKIYQSKFGNVKFEDEVKILKTEQSEHKIEEKEEEKETENSNEIKEEKKEEGKFLLPNGKKKPYWGYLKEAFIYMHINDTTIYDLREGNSFQDKPFQEPYSEEFIELIKTGSLQQVEKELFLNPKFLFSHDLLWLTPYHWATKLGRIPILKALIAYGKHLNQKDNKGRTPLHWAAINNNYEAAKILLEHGACCTMYDHEGHSPLDLATDSRVKSLIRDKTPKASNYDHYHQIASEVVKALKNRKKQSDLKKEVKTMFGTELDDD